MATSTVKSVFGAGRQRALHCVRLGRCAESGGRGGRFQVQELWSG